MAPSVRIARPGDGAGIARVWLDTSAYYAELDPGHFKVPDAHDLAELTDDQIGVSDDRTLSLVAEVDGRLVGWLSARLELPHHNASRQFVREHGWTRLLVDALIVEREQWRRGIGTMLLEAAESWGPRTWRSGSPAGYLRARACSSAVLRTAHGISAPLDRLSEAAMTFSRCRRGSTTAVRMPPSLTAPPRPAGIGI